MSVHVSASVWDGCRQSGEALLVMLALADHSNDAGESWPSLDRIADMARVEKRSVIRILKRLEDAGEIVVERGGGRGHTNRYILAGYARPVPANSDAQSSIPAGTVTPVSPIVVTNGDTVSPIGRRETVTLVPETVTLEPERVTLVHETVTPGSPEPSEPSENRQEEPPGETTPRDDQRMFDSLCAVYGTTPATILGNARGRFNKAIAEWRAEGVTPDDLDRGIAIYRSSYKGSQGERPTRLDLDDVIGQARAGAKPRPPARANGHGPARRHEPPPSEREAARIEAAIAASMEEATARVEAQRTAEDDVARQALAGILDRLRLTTVPATFRQWYAPLEAISLDAGVLTVRHPLPGVAELVRQRGTALLAEAAAEIGADLVVVVEAPPPVAPDVVDEVLAEAAAIPREWPPARTPQVVVVRP